MNVILNTPDNERAHFVLSRNSSNIRPQTGLEILFDNRPPFFRSPNTMHQAGNKGMHARKVGQ
jgi:hypothetical protein